MFNIFTPPKSVGNRLDFEYGEIRIHIKKPINCRSCEYHQSIECECNIFGCFLFQIYQWFYFRLSFKTKLDNLWRIKVVFQILEFLMNHILLCLVVTAKGKNVNQVLHKIAYPSYDKIDFFFENKLCGIVRCLTSFIWLPFQSRSYQSWINW